MADDLSGVYEALLPITLDPNEGPAVQAGELIGLGHEDAEVFLFRRFVRKPDKEGDAGRVSRFVANLERDADERLNDELSVPDDAGRDALIAGGYDSDELVMAATDDELLGLPGIGEATLAKIRASLPE